MAQFSGTGIEKPYQFLVKVLLVAICINSSAFICEKFYRGKNTGDAPGSGLGLYIVTYILKRMDGELKLRNHADGLDAVVTFELADVPGEKIGN